MNENTGEDRLNINDIRTNTLWEIIDRTFIDRQFKPYEIPTIKYVFFTALIKSDNSISVVANIFCNMWCCRKNFMIKLDNDFDVDRYLKYIGEIKP